MPPRAGQNRLTHGTTPERAKRRAGSGAQWSGPSLTSALSPSDRANSHRVSGDLSQRKEESIMLFPVLPVPEVSFVPFAAYELATQNMERHRSMADRDDTEIDFSVFDIAALEKAGLL